MSIPTGITAGDLVIKGIPELACFNTFTDLLKALPQYLGVEIPSSVTNVIVGPTQPSSSQTTAVWFRLSNSGSFLGIYVFSQGQWHPIYPVADGTHYTIQWFFSDDGTAPAGWTIIDTGDTTISAPVVAALKTHYVGSGPYSYFAAYFTSF